MHSSMDYTIRQSDIDYRMTVSNATFVLSQTHALQASFDRFILVISQSLFIKAKWRIYSSVK